MTRIRSMLLSSARPDRLRDWYLSAFELELGRTPGEGPGYDLLDFGGTFICLDSREDVGEKNTEPGRLILNIDVDGRWLAPLEDREGSLFATAIDPDGNYVQIIQLSEEHRAKM
ncbi:MAG: VOC family protein [Mycobacteriaceae bacterium]|nr:VOC family protein [Mycobacteriaceae bacterium]